MRFLRGAAAILASASLAYSHSTSRNPLSQLAIARNVTIDTPNHRITAVSDFDLYFDLQGKRIRLDLEPNHDILEQDATISYLGADGEIVRSEPIQRLDHKVFKGESWLQDSPDGKYSKAGWARIMVHRDGVHPLFEGAFTIGHDHHHILLSSNYRKTRNEMDPEIAPSDEESMVVFRDSDYIEDEIVHGELKKRAPPQVGCMADNLEFNLDPAHPIYAGVDQTSMNKRWWGTPIYSLFEKRQMDVLPTGGGNSAGVNLASTVGNTAGCPSTRKVALVGVATDCTYTSDFNSTESVRQNIINQINSASDLYEKTFNISLGLRNLTISNATCPGSPPSTTPWNQPCTPDVDIQDRLNLFSAWRGTQGDDNSHWTLLTKCNSGSAVGLAWLGQACVTNADSRNASGVGETVSGANVVARTATEWQVIAHETGHTFGAVHDCTDQTCNDGTTVNAQQCCPLSSTTCDAGEKFMMNPTTSRGITAFSACTIGNICSAMGRNQVNTSCFKNNRGVITISGQQCGNGIVEAGEDCDCGGAEGCGNNQCCDPKTCKFKDNAKCDDSNEDCCHNCQLASAQTVCRASTGVCDPEERCSGSSPNCPADTTAPDGQKCGNNLQCSTGHCTSRDLQCKTLMGSYTTGNDTYACDQYTCQLSCASPEFGNGVCYGLQQNFLDGTECGGGGRCQNGQCKGSNVGKEIKGFLDKHKGVVIGVASAIGFFIALAILGCIYRCCKRRRYRKSVPKRALPSPPLAAGFYGGGGRRAAPPPPVQQQGPWQQHGGARRRSSIPGVAAAAAAVPSGGGGRRGSRSATRSPAGPQGSSEWEQYPPPPMPPPMSYAAGGGGSVRYA